MHQIDAAIGSTAPLTSALTEASSLTSNLTAMALPPAATILAASACAASILMSPMRPRRLPRPA